MDEFNKWRGAIYKLLEELGVGHAYGSYLADRHGSLHQRLDEEFR